MFIEEQTLPHSRAKLTDWKIINHQGKILVAGTVWDNKHFTNGQLVVTSPVKYFQTVAGVSIVETRSGTIYELMEC